MAARTDVKVSEMKQSRRRCTRTVAIAAATTTLTATLASPAIADQTGLSALVGADCSNGTLQLALNNQTATAQTLRIDMSGAQYTREIPAGGNSLLRWTRDPGTEYSVIVTAPGFRKTENGRLDCGLAAGTPQMNSRTLFDTSTRFADMKRADGSTYTGTAKSVRIPAMAVTNANTVLAVTDIRVSGSGDLGMGDNDIQVGLRRSTDSGATWSDARAIAATGAEQQGFGDASLLVDRTTGRIFCFFTHSPAEGVSFFSSQPGSNAADDKTSLHVKYVSSDDDGRSWSEPVELNPQVKNPDWGGIFTSSGHGTQLSDGRLLQPIAYRDGAGVSHAANIYSDDGGQSWHTGGTAGSEVNESKVIERGNGEVEQNLRHNTDSRRYYATSADGAATFGAQFPATLIDPKVNADEISYLRPAERTDGKPHRTSTALFSNPSRTDARNDLTVRYSADDASSYSDGALLKPGAAGYSTMSVLDDGTVGNLYEIGDTGGIVFARFTLDWVKGA